MCSVLQSGDTALHKAAHGGHADVVIVLIKAGANVNSTNVVGHCWTGLSSNVCVGPGAMWCRQGAARRLVLCHTRSHNQQGTCAPAHARPAPRAEPCTRVPWQFTSTPMHDACSWGAAHLW